MLTLFVCAVLVVACSSTVSTNNANESNAELTAIFQSALLTATYGVPTLTPTQKMPDETSTPPVPTSDPNRTPPVLPQTYVSSLLNKKDTPHSYLQDTCQYLKMRWDPNNSAPGTVVMPIMFHSITDGQIVDNNQISHEFLIQLLNNLKDQGFQTITAQQLADFLDNNAKIPQRSVILILDDRRPGAVKEHFMPILEKYNWSLTLGWLIGSGADSTDLKPASPLKSQPNEDFKTLWQQMEAYYASGRLDVQAHGFVHNIPMGSSSTEEFIYGEIYNPITILEQHFGKKPIAFIWPGGGFAKRPVEVAREAGYRLGFTVNPRGPLMFNWIPQADIVDPARPSYMPEAFAGDPRMTLPRFWDTDATYRIDEVRLIGKEAAAYAEQNRQTELEYYDIVCKPMTGEIPKLIKN